jgi:thiamine-phosphate pyrophosphorylase
VEAVEAALAGGVDCVQLRDKDLPGGALYNLARDLRTVTARVGVPLLVNDRIDVALAVRAHGVQLGAGSIPVGEARRLLPPGALIGYSAHSAAEAEGAALAGADFILFAPVFPTASKTAAAAGPEALWRLCAVSPIPVYALGGITAERLRGLMNPPPEAGRAPAGAAVISAILAAEDVTAAARTLRESLGGPVAPDRAR